jgi:hypothetical protein
MTKENETPDAVAEVDLQAAAALIALVKSAAGSSGDQAGANMFGTSGERFNQDIGLDEMYKYGNGIMAVSAATVKVATDAAQTLQTLGNAFLTNLNNADNNFVSFLAKCNAKDQQSLAEAIKWESDNEIMSTAVLANMVNNLVDKRLAALVAAGDVDKKGG